MAETESFQVLADYISEDEFKKQIGNPSQRTMERYYNEPNGLAYVVVMGKKHLRKAVIKDWLLARERQKNPLRKRGDRQRAAAPTSHKPLRPARPPKRTLAKTATAAAMATSAPGENAEV